MFRAISFLLLLCACNANTESDKAAVHTVVISGMQFQPAVLQVNVNDTVVFINKDMVTHDVTEASSKKWRSRPLKVGDSWKLVVEETADYYCTIHPTMKGNVEIKE